MSWMRRRRSVSGALANVRAEAPRKMSDPPDACARRPPGPDRVRALHGLPGAARASAA